MIEPHHRTMILDMFARGMTVPAIHHAMGAAIRRSDIELVIAEKSDADRRAAAIVRREVAQLRLRRQRIAEEKAIQDRIRVRREALALVAGYRVLTIIPSPRKRKDL